MLWSIINRDDLYPDVLVSVRGPVDLLGRREEKEVIKVVNWHMPTSISPMGYAISVRSDDAMSRIIAASRNFVVNFMGHDQKSIVLSAENQDGVFTDLFEYLGVSRALSERVESPRIREARAFLECEVEQELESGDHTIFISRVVGSGRY